MIQLGVILKAIFKILFLVHSERLPPGGAADRSQTGFLRRQREGDLPGAVSMVPAARGRGGDTGSDVSGAPAAHDPDGDAERGATVGPGEPGRPAGRHKDALREPQHGPELPGDAQ